MVVSRQNERLFDLRTVRRNVRSGLLTRDKVEEYLRSLPDMSENIAPLSNMDDDGEGKSPRGEGGGTVASPSFPRRLDMPVDTDEDLDALGDDEDDEDDDDDDDDDDASDTAVTAAAPAPVVAPVPVAVAAPAPVVAPEPVAPDAADDAVIADADTDEPAPE